MPTKAELDVEIAELNIKIDTLESNLTDAETHANSLEDLVDELNLKLDDFDLDNIDAENLVDNLESRNYIVYSENRINQEVSELFELKRINSSEFDVKFAEYIYNTIGRIL